MSDLTAERLLLVARCNLGYEIYDDYQHIKSNGILGSLGKFCVAFYHVPVNNEQSCLDKDNCKAAADGPSWTPRSVVALVKYEMYNGSNIIVRYSNHYIYRGTKHAEEFFKDDINQPQNEALRSSISNGNLRKITIYITSQPCHLSVGNTPDKSCCDVLLELFVDRRLTGVEMCIKPTHIYEAGRPDLVENGMEGIRELMASGIEITRMEEADWKYLLNLVDMTDGKRQHILSGYSGNEREALDVEIGKFLHCQHLQLALECPSTHNRLSVKHFLVKQHGVLHLLDNLSQFCAFYHVFEQGAGNERVCLSGPQCPYHINGKWKPNVIVVKGTYQNGGAAYEAKYTDCLRFGIKAEEFLNFNAETVCKNLKQITIYTTWLPRGFHSIVDHLSRSLVAAVCIKVSHLHGGDDTSREDFQNEVDALRSNRQITVRAMTKDDWEYLTENLPEVNRDAARERYGRRRRQRLDKEIDVFLNPL